MALVGYTNAGKSTLFNALTKASTRAEDLLFATLDPLLRRTKLPHGLEIIVSDTVGFISNLPTHLVAAFKATLEEVIEADLILHVRDVSHPDTAIQSRDVEAVLKQLGVDPEEGRLIEVWNKIDLLPRGTTPDGDTEGEAQRRLEPVMVSALTGQGLPGLLTAIEEQLGADRGVFRVVLSGEGLADLHHLYEMGEVLARDDREDGTTEVTIRVAEKSASAFRRKFPSAAIAA